jgi:tetratricopeptide (TPR) repeat protein
MAERYKQLIKTGTQYQTNSPVILVASALLLDTYTQHVLAQLKLESITSKPIVAVSVVLECFDPAGSTVLCREEFWYRDLDVRFESQFGQKTPIAISQDAVRSFAVHVKTIVFSSGDTWEAADSKQVMQNIPDKEPISAILSTELAEQYYRECKKLSNRNIKNAPKKHKDFVFCACGSIYSSVETACPNCGVAFDNYAQLINGSFLYEQHIAYREEQRIAAEMTIEQQRIKTEADAEEQRIVAEKTREKQKRTIKRLAIILPTIAIVVMLIILYLKVFMPAGHYKSGEELLTAGDYEGAVMEFIKAGNYKDAVERVPSEYYDIAEGYFTAGNYEHAIIWYQKAGGYQDARKKFENCLSQLGGAISAGLYHTVGLKADGTVVAVGDSNGYNQCSVSDWQDIVAISAGNYHTVGLKADGTVLAVGNSPHGRCDVSGWQDIVAISAANFHTVGLKADGTVVEVRNNPYGSYDLSGWHDIVAISAGGSHTVGLKADGTVVATNSGRERGQCNVSDWQDIVAISAGQDHTVGLKADGTVVAANYCFYDYDDQCNVSDWQDIVAISAGQYHTVGLKADGTVVAVGNNPHCQCCVSGWRDIVAISAGECHTVGLKADGTVLAAGQNNPYGRCNTSGWKLW